MTMAASVQPHIPAHAGFLRRHQRELSVLLAYGALLGLLALRSQTFFQKEFRATWVATAPVLVASIGMTLVILARHIDISIGSMFSICAVTGGVLAKMGMPMPAVAACTLLAGGLMGAVNGALVAMLGLPSIVVTLATMVIFREALRLVREGEFVNNLPANFQWFGASQRGGEALVLLASAGVFVIFAWALRWVAAGRAVYAVGSDQEAARLAGMRPKRVVFWVFVIMGALTGLSALLNSVRFASVDPNSGTGLELQVIAAVVVGGVAISGGRGTLVGTLLGVILLGTIGPALGFLNTKPEWERAIQGAIILVAVASDSLDRRAR
jgi:rhamnose transport system permease protein